MRPAPRPLTCFLLLVLWPSSWLAASATSLAAARPPLPSPAHELGAALVPRNGGRPWDRPQSGPPHSGSFVAPGAPQTSPLEGAHDAPQTWAAHETGLVASSRWPPDRRRQPRAAPPQANADCMQPQVFGIRCDEGAEIAHDGALTIKANEPTRLILIGRRLELNLSLALTPIAGEPLDDCTHTDRVKSLPLVNVTPHIAHIHLDLASPGARQAYYLCLREQRDGSGWFHQGSAPWLKLYVKQDFLPLYMKIVVIACLLMLSGLFSGLNLGLMALDKNELQVIISCGTETEKRYARAIEPVRRRGNYLLCSILFANVLVNSTIAVLLEELTSGIVAVMASTICIVMFGEILPQAFCSRHGLAVGAKTVLITYLCMIVTFPLSWPVSACLDWALGEEIGHAYDRERLMEFIRVTRDYNNLETDEVNIISGALKLKRIQLSEIMTRIEDVYMLDVQSVLDFDTIQAIIERGYSRIPVHEAANKRNIVALLFAKDLALLDPDDKTPVQTMISFYNHPIMYLFEDTTLDIALNEFKTGKSHMAFVRRVIDDGDRDPFYEITGIVTLEDVIEEIMQMEINDETDTLTDNRRKRRRKEAQVRKDFSQFTNLGAGDSSHNVVTPQLCLAAYQYLATTVEPFSAKFISDSILKRLLSQKIFFKVRSEDASSRGRDGSHQQQPAQNAQNAGKPLERAQDERRLYTAGEPADYFVMILEGRVHVVCGKERLVFDGGPFSFFGKAALTPGERTDTFGVCAPAACGAPMRKESSSSRLASQSMCGGGGGAPEQQPARRSSLATGRGLSGQFSISTKRLEDIVNDQHALDNSPSNANASLNVSVTTDLGGAAAKLKPSESRISICSIETKPGLQFVPDYTVEIVSNASYLKIKRSEYLAALRATLVERGGAGAGGSCGPATDDEASLAAYEPGPTQPLLAPSSKPSAPDQ